MPDIALMPNATPHPPSATRAETSLRARDEERGPAEGGVSAWQGEGFSFGDVLDFINPLQHIPVVNKIYREITGDQIGAAARIGGGTLFGGIAGLVASVADTVLEAATGRDAADTVVAALRAGTMDEAPDDVGTDVAEILGYAEKADVAALDGERTSELASERTDNGAADTGPGTPLAAAQPATPVTLQAAAPQPVIPATNRPFARFSTASPPPVAATPSPANTAPAARAVPPGTTAMSASPQPLQTAVPLQGVRGVAQPSSPRPAPSLPNPQALAGDPGMVEKMRPGGWMQVLSAAQGAAPDTARGTSRGGPGALATGTVARALAGYAAANELPVPQQR